MLKKEKWEASKHLIKEKNKEKKRQKKLEGKSMNHKNHGSVAHLSRFTIKDKDKPEGERTALSKKQKQELFKDLCNKGPTVVVDCEFDDLMLDREKQSMAAQLAYVHNINKR